MATKPKSMKVARVGTKVYNVLKIMLTDRPVTDSLGDLQDHLDDEYGIDVGMQNLSQYIRYFNEGLYSVDGITCADERIVYHSNDLPPSEYTEDMFEPSSEDLRTPEVKTNTTPEDESKPKLSTFEEECIEAGIDPSQVAGGWVKKKGISIRCNTTPSAVQSWDIELDEAINRLKESKFFEQPKATPIKEDDLDSVGVVNIADLHIGAFVQGLTKTPDFNDRILKDRLFRAAEVINDMGFDVVRVNLLGDVIESFTGLNHPNTFKEMGGVYGAKLVQLAVEILHTCFLSQIKNLGKINYIGGNHGRTSSSNKEDTKAGAEDMIAWGLKLVGYDVEFNPLVISEKIDGIQYILFHGDKGVSKRLTTEILWTYGSREEKTFNFVLQGHLHSRIQTMSAKAIDKMEVVSDDSIWHRRQVLPSFFTGNSYSDENNWLTASGFTVCYNNGEGRPITVDIPVQ